MGHVTNDCDYTDVFEMGYTATSWHIYTPFDFKGTLLDNPVRGAMSQTQLTITIMCSFGDLEKVLNNL